MRRVARIALAVGGVYTTICALIFGLGGELIAGAFTRDAELVALSVRLLIFAAVFQVFAAANMISRCTLRGTGDIRFPAIVGTLISWSMTPPAMWLLGYHMGLGAVGGWIGLSAEIMIGAVIFVLRVERRGWREAAGRARAVREAAGRKEDAEAA